MATYVAYSLFKDQCNVHALYRLCVIDAAWLCEIALPTSACNKIAATKKEHLLRRAGRILKAYDCEKGHRTLSSNMMTKVDL